MDGGFVTATVELGGLPATCNKTASASSEIIPGAQLVVSGTFTSGQDLKKAVQRFIAASNFDNEPETGTSVIYLYKKSSNSVSEYQNFEKAIISAFEFNKILPSQYRILDGGTRKLAKYEFYLLHPGAKEPGPSL